MLSNYKFIFSILVGSTLFFLFGCSGSEQKSLKEAISSLSSNKKIPANQRIHQVDSLIHYPFQFTIPSEDIYKLYEIKRDALVEINDIPSAVETNDKIIHLAQSLQDSLTISKSLLFYYLQDLDNNYFQQHISYYPSILTFTSKCTDQLVHAKNIVNYASILMFNAKYQEAEKQYFNAERIFRKYRSDIDLIKVYLGLGNILLYSHSREKAGVYYSKALDLSRQVKNTGLIASSLMNLAITKKINNPDSALQLYKEALSLLTKPEENFLRIKIKFNMSNIYKAQNNFKKTEQILKEILAECIEQNFIEGVGVVTGSLGSLYAQQGQLEKSIILLESSKQKTDSLQLKNLSNAFLPDLIYVYQRTNQFEKAFRLSQELISQTDSSVSLEKQKEILNLESKFTSEIKDIENAQLARVGHLWEILTWGLCIVLFCIVLLYFYNIKSDTEKQKAQLYLVNFYKSQLDKAQSNYSRSKNPSLSSHLSFVLLTQKPFTIPTLTLDDLAHLLDVSPDELLEEIIARKYQSFEEFIHFHRIEEARVLIDSMELDSIDDVFYKVGFTSKNYFNLIFEEVTGLKSEYYIKNVVKG